MNPMKKLLLLSVLLLAACTSVQQEQTTHTGKDTYVPRPDTPIEQNLSWFEKKVASFGYQEKDLNLSMEEMIEKQKKCDEYATEIYGGSYNSKENGVVVMYEHKYSPRFDRCFTKQNYSDSGGVGLEPLSRVMIIDVINDETLFIYNRGCAKFTDKTRYTEAEYQDLCPNEWDVDQLWSALIKSVDGK